MKQHKNLLTRSTAAHAFATAHMQIIKNWLSNTIIALPGSTVNCSVLTDRFISCHTQFALALQRHYHNRGVAPSLQILVDSLLDACLALSGVGKHDGAYLNVMLPV
jgi:hypothetical protein